MKYGFLLLVLVLCLSCKKDIVSFNPDENGIISLAVGNKYTYHETVISGMVLTDWFSHDEILHDTIIAGYRYYNFSDKEFLRLDGNRVLKYSAEGEKVKYDYDVEIGDLCNFGGKPLKE